MKKIAVLMVSIIFFALLTACQKDKPTTGGGGGNSATISGTVNVDGTTLTIYDMVPTGKVLYGPTIIGTSYSAKFSVNGPTNVEMVFSKSGCRDDGKSIDVRPGANINVGGATLTCG